MRFERWAMVSALLCDAAASQPEIEVIALDGDPVPGVVPAQVFDFGNVLGRNVPVVWIDDLGRVAVQYEIADPAVPTGEVDGIWAWDRGDISLVAREGSLLPGPGGVATVVELLTGWRITPGGRVLLGGRLATGERGLWQRAARDVAFNAFALGGQQAPAQPAGETFGTLVLSGGRDSARQVFFSGLDVGGASGEGNSLWAYDSSGELGLVARFGDPAPGFGGPAEFRSIPASGFDFFPVGSSGMGFRAEARDAATNADLGAGLWVGGPGSIDLVLKDGDVVSPERFVLSVQNFRHRWLGDDRVLLQALLGSDIDQPPPGFDGFLAWLVVGEGAPRLLMQDGGLAPDCDGTPRSDVPIRFIGNAATSPGRPHFAMSAFIDETAVGGDFFVEGLYLSDGDTVREILRGNQPAPGLDGQVFATAAGFAVNRLGQVAAAVRTKPAGGSPGGPGLWVQDRRGELRAALLPGDVIDVGSGGVLDERVVEEVRFTDGAFPPSSRGQQINGAGDTVVYVLFADGDHAVLVVRDLTPCIADVNGDGAVDPSDFMAWVSAFNDGTPICDQNRDGVCDARDFSSWIVNYNTGCP